MEDLLSCWKNFNLNRKPYLHQKDDVLRSEDFFNYTNYDEFINSSDFGSKDHKFHFGLLPVPYIGDLKNAKVFILLLNPGFNILDYYAESNDKLFKEYMIKNIKQELENDPYPFFKLNPKFIWHGKYWVSKLNDIIDEVKIKKNLPSYAESLSFVSKNIAALELVPYHSKSFKLSDKKLNQLYTSQIMLEWVNDYLVPKVRNGEACIILTRKASMWNLPKHKNIVVYSGSETRGAHLSRNTEGGKKILEFLLK